MSTKDQDDYDDFCQLQPAQKWSELKTQRARADLAELRVGELTKAIQAAHDRLRDDYDNCPTEPYITLLGIVPEVTP